MINFFGRNSRNAVIIKYGVTSILLISCLWYFTKESDENRITREILEKLLMILPDPSDGGDTEEDKEPAIVTFLMTAFNKLSGDLFHDEPWPSLISKTFELPCNMSYADLKAVTSLKRDLLQLYRDIHPNPDLRRRTREKTGVTINLAMVACGQSRRAQAITMLKSAAIFSQDSDLHVVVFGDREEIFNLAVELLVLRWQVNAAGWDFTFELHLEWFPKDKPWGTMFAKCATQRLFFPRLLQHIDSIIYLDTDTVVLSNLTDFYLEFNKMNNTKLAAASCNNEPRWDNPGFYRSRLSQIPFYSTHGLNAGVMLMNLTLMREFDMESRSSAAHSLYWDKIALADQDIYNIIFHSYPELFHELPCTYNFHWAYCGLPRFYNKCYNERGEHTCWCRSLDTTGLYIIHGNTNTFTNKYLHFLPAIYNGFRKFDLTRDSPLQLIKELEQDYLSKPQNRCHRLTADMLYNNAKTYLSKIYD